MTLLWPREHGAWGILLVPFLTAVAIAGRPTPAVLLALAAVLLTFLARYPLELWLVPGSRLHAVGLAPNLVRRFAWLYSLLAAALGALLLAVWKLYLLLPLALLAALVFGFRLWALRRRAERGWSAELLGTTGLTLSALVGWIAATGQLNQTGVLVWLLNCTFFCSGIVSVKSRLCARQAVHRPAMGQATSFVLGFHLAVVLFVLTLVFLRWASPLVMVPFAVAAVRAGWSVRQYGRAFALRRLGWSELVLSLLFAAFLTLGFRL